MSYDGKDCFRMAWAQRPFYGGGNIAAVALKENTAHTGAAATARDAADNVALVSADAAASRADRAKQAVLCMAHQGVLHVVDYTSGVVLCSHDAAVEEDDIILHVAAVAGTPAPPQPEEAPPAAEDAAATTEAKKAPTGKEAKEQGHSTLRAAVPAADAFIAISTRSLQVTVLRLDVTEERVYRPVPVEDVDEEATEGDDAEKAAAQQPAQQELVDILYTYTLTKVKSWAVAQHAVGCLAFSPDAAFLASGSTDGGLKIWAVFQHFLSHQFRGRGGVVTSLAFSADGGIVAAGTVEGYISVIDFESKRVLAASRTHTSAVEALSAVVATTAETAAEGASYVVLSVGRDRTLQVQDAKTLSVLKAVAIADQIQAVTFASPYVALYGSMEGHVGALSVDPKTYAAVIFARLQAPPQAVEEEHGIRALAVLPPSFAVDGSASQSHRLLRERLVIADASWRIMFAQAGPAVPNAASTFIYDRTWVPNLDQVLDCRYVPLPGLAAPAVEEEEEEDGATPALVAAAPSFGRVVATNTRDCYIFKPAAGADTYGTLVGHKDTVVTIDVCPSGTRILTGSKDMTARVWDVATQRCLGITSNVHESEALAKGQRRPAGQAEEVKKPVHTGALTGVRFITNGPNSKDAAGLACAVAVDGVLSIWDVAAASIASSSTEAAVLPLTSSIAGAHDGAAHCVAVAPNGLLLASGGKDKSVAVWNMRGKRVYREGQLKGHRRAVTSVAFSPADRVLASASSDDTVRLWSLVSLTCVRTLQADRAAVLQCQFFNKGQQLVSANAEGVVRMWAVVAGETVASVAASGSRLWALTTLEQGAHTEFLCGGADGVVSCIEDFTAQEVERLREERRDTTEKEQELTNCMQLEDYAAAFRVALRLGHPRHLRRVIATWMARTRTLPPLDAPTAPSAGARRERDLFEYDSDADAAGGEDEAAAQEEDPCEVGIAAAVRDLKEKELHKLLEFVREWMTNARHSAVAGIVVAGLLRAHTAPRLQTMPAFTVVVEALWGYGRRHLHRLHRAMDQLLYLEYLTHGATAAAGAPQTAAAGAAVKPAGATKGRMSRRALAIAAQAAAAEAERYAKSTAAAADRVMAAVDASASAAAAPTPAPAAALTADVAPAPTPASKKVTEASPEKKATTVTATAATPASTKKGKKGGK